jgi:hypothetical protein
MGTEILLSLNGIVIDYGKNRYWKSHTWLFPQGSITNVKDVYAGDAGETKPGFQTTLNEAYFRLRHLGYSSHETKAKFEATVARWNRTADLELSFADFHDALTSIDFPSLTTADLAPYIWDFRRFVENRLSAWDTDDAQLDDFINSLDLAITLRVLADRVDNRSLPLCWHHHDLVENGWAAFDDLTDIDRPTFIMNHTVLYGRLHDYAGSGSVKAFDNWLASRGLAKSKSYVELRPDGTEFPKETTLPTAVRNMIHHPENQRNVLSDDDLRDSIELLLGVAKRVSPPLPGLA